MSRPFFSVSYERPAVYPTPSKVRVVEEDARHTLAFIEVVDEQRVKYRTGDPITVRWGHAPESVRTMTGYINHIEPVANSGQVHGAVQILGIGATWIAKGGNRRIMRNRTATSAVKEVTRPLHLSYLADDPGTHFSTLVQADMSDWQFLGYIARRAGLLLAPDNTDVRLIDPDKDRSAKHASARLYSSPVSNLPTEGKVYWVHAMSGDTADAAGMSREWVSYTMSPENERMVAAKTNPRESLRDAPIPLFRSYVDLEPTDFPGETRDELKNHARANRFTYTARASVEGSPYLRVGQHICFLGYDPSVNGMWVVRKVEHIVQHNQYACELELGRSYPYDLGERPLLPLSRLVQSASGPHGELKFARPGARLVGRRWRAEWSA